MNRLIIILITIFLSVGVFVAHKNNKAEPVEIKNITAGLVLSDFRFHNVQLQKNLDATVGSGLDKQGLGKLIRKSVDEGNVGVNNSNIVMGVSAHHLPVASPLIGEFYKTLLVNKGPRDVFVIVGPDHYEKCKANFAVTDLAYETPFGLLETDKEIVGKIQQSGASVNDECFVNEHSMAVHANYIKYLYPNARIVPIIFSVKSTEVEKRRVMEVILKQDKNVFILGSIDFNHYHNVHTADVSDAKASDAILKLNSSAIVQDMLDSPVSMKLLLDMAREKKLNPKITRNANSYEFTGQPENTTSYMNILFIK